MNFIYKLYSNATFISVPLTERHISGISKAVKMLNESVVCLVGMGTCTLDSISDAHNSFAGKNSHNYCIMNVVCEPLRSLQFRQN